MLVLSEHILPLLGGILLLATFVLHRQTKKDLKELKDAQMNLNYSVSKKLTDDFLRDAVARDADKIVFGEPPDDRPRITSNPRMEDAAFWHSIESVAECLVDGLKAEHEIDPELMRKCKTQVELHDALTECPLECRVPAGEIEMWFRVQSEWTLVQTITPKLYLKWFGALPTHFTNVPDQKPWQGRQYIRVPREGQKAFYVKCRVCIEANYCLSIELLERFVEK